MKKLFLLGVLLIFSTATFAQTKKDFDIEGHRGARGLLPENTIPAFLKAVELGVDTLELDVVISQGGKVVVSHDPFFSSAFSLDKDGNPIAKEKEKEFNIFKMPYSEIKLFDVGSLGNKNFPEQQKLKTVKPLLKDVFTEVQKYIKKNKLKQVRYNIEIKSSVAEDNIFVPVPTIFAKKVYDEILKYKMQKNVIVQSFDVRPLQEMRKFPVKLPIALLVGDKTPIEQNLKKLGFQPETYSPHFSLVDEATIKYCHERGIKIVVWTVNETADFERMKKFDLDGIITDYPDRAIKIYRDSKNKTNHTN